MQRVTKSDWSQSSRTDIFRYINSKCKGKSLEGFGPRVSNMLGIREVICREMMF